jgi:hypothetical protein
MTEEYRNKKKIYHIKAIHHRKALVNGILTDCKSQKRSATIRSNFSSDKIRRTFLEEPL